jgi:hypothetical protein
MKGSCNIQHEMILFEGKKCPLCVAIEMRRKYLDEIVALRRRLARQRKIINKLFIWGVGNENL